MLNVQRGSGKTLLPSDDLVLVHKVWLTGNVEVLKNESKSFR